MKVIIMSNQVEAQFRGCVVAQVEAQFRMLPNILLNIRILWEPEPGFLVPREQATLMYVISCHRKSLLVTRNDFFYANR